MVICKPIEPANLKKGLPVRWKVVRQGQNKSGAEANQEEELEGMEDDWQMVSEKMADLNVLDQNNGLYYQNEYFLVVLYDSWAVFQRVKQKQYRVLYKSPFYGDADDQMFRIVAECTSLEEATKDFEELSTKLIPILREDPTRGRFITQLVASILKPEKAAQLRQNTMEAKTLGPYFVKKVLGMGSFGKVKLGIHRQTKEEVAIKMVSHDSVEHVETNNKEIAILQSLHHPFVIGVKEVIQTRKYMCIILEFAKNGDLLEYLNSFWDRCLTEVEAQRVFFQISSGVSYLHDHKIIHRDLKPNNVLMDGNNNCKLSDFGLSKKLNETDILTTACGSPIYAAPELLTRQYFGRRVDVWSLGVILFNIGTGKMPFGVDASFSIPMIYEHINRARSFGIPASCKMGPGWHELIEMTLDVDQERRATMAEILDHSWLIRQRQKDIAQPSNLDSSAARRRQYQRDADAMVGKTLYELQDVQELINSPAGQTVNGWRRLPQKQDTKDRTGVDVFVPTAEPPRKKGELPRSVIHFAAQSLVVGKMNLLMQRWGTWEKLVETLFTDTNKIEILDDDDYIGRWADVPETCHDRVPRDMVTLNARRDIQDVGVLFAATSTVHHSSHACDGYVRAKVGHSSWLFEPVSDNSVLITTVQEIDLMGNVDPAWIDEVLHTRPTMQYDSYVFLYYLLI
ncbi:CAMK/CAMKL protein kinase [Sphaeroforma arctica JP610]|uniref:CAMK/CAMKL protein kinase n=1 Tax=Sphaeroforma arctica JP610 TaxID=667725 RepID=A0A0L0G561_9EUKA|nr:CAMK/CAMKL protein kinase [Sphaeroforma arctica JP610]KNC84172.1 CAMK/CAMKL protein kinase [Sphaeroforma arctica JP610]|eukprot:XP_014158074.1 CAMK/CAMKL protein kinase [Sphaeroforma arctica JP610]